ARVAGLVERLNVEEGDRVARGALLCRLEDDDYRLARDKAKVNYDKQQADFQRLKDMHEKQLTSTQEFEDARFKLEQARIDWETAKLNLERTRISASIDGVVTNRYIRQGELVDMAKPLFRIVDITEKIAVVHIPEREIGRIRKGQQAYLSTDNLPDRRFEAAVKRLAPAVDASSGTLKVTVGVRDPENRLRPGMFVSVHIVTETHRDALLIPKAAVVYENGMPFSFFVEQDTLARKVMLERGFSDEKNVEVLSSVCDTDRVVVVGQNGLKDGARVRVVAGLLEQSRQTAEDTLLSRENRL
ncbi:MAG: efflux RND transporter periplasmic adaptor subunit, partial [Candidatus Glassbacteria bacterium]|nr:efflux RND transporter periplasmic adaptor subunit [Candidatus Glassbacteria bacterium]